MLVLSLSQALLTLPVIMKVEYSYKNAFTIEVGEDVALNNTLIGVIE